MFAVEIILDHPISESDRGMYIYFPFCTCSVKLQFEGWMQKGSFCYFIE